MYDRYIRSAAAGRAARNYAAACSNILEFYYYLLLILGRQKTDKPRGWSTPQL